jgi:hypothetical protein
MSIDRIAAVSPVENMASRSKIMKRSAESKGKASRSCCATQEAVGLVVMEQRHIAAAVADDEKHMKDAKHRGGHREEVHRGDAVPVVSEERPPGGVGPRCAGQGPQVSRDAALGDVEAEALQLSMDAGRAPGVLGCHPPDECSDLPRQARTAGARSSPGQPVPVGAKPGAMPAHHRVRPDDGEGLGPTAPETAQQDPEDPIGGPDVWVPPPGQGGELLAEGQVLEHEISPRTHGGAERRQEGYKEAEHRAGENPGPGRNRQWFHLGRSFGER